MFLFKNILIYVAVSGLHCGIRDVRFLLWQEGHLLAAFELLAEARGTQFPDQGSDPVPLHWEHRVSATRPTREVPVSFFYIYI